MSLRVAVVGCGLIGRRRAVVAREAGDRVVAVADVDAAKAGRLAAENGCAWATDWCEVVGREDVDVVVAATPNKVLAPVTIAAAGAGKHVLCEKPLGRNSGEARDMVHAAERAGVVLKTGFNHRHHPAVWRAKELCSQGAIGPLKYIRAVYGHGGRPGYDKEWRADADLAGGGELLDQGVHIVDLCRWFLGEFREVSGFTGTYFWDLAAFGNAAGPDACGDPRTRPQVPGAASAGPRRLEDNAFAIMRTHDGCIAQLHTSWTQWKNRFSFEVFGVAGYLRIEGLGGSYGTESLTLGRRRPESGPPVQETFEFPGPDQSWNAEWKELTAAVREHRRPLADGREGLAAMRLIAAIYESARTGCAVRVESD